MDFYLAFAACEAALGKDRNPAGFPGQALPAITVQEFHDHVTKWLRGKVPVVVTRYGKEPLGVYYPASAKDAPKEIRWAIFEALTDRIGVELKRKGVTEEDVLKDFDEWRKQHGKARR